MDKLVSIISPCYNGEKYLFNFLESILNQTYSKIEFIIIDDGSTDNSKDIILSYKNKFESKGYIFKYIYQNNQGQAGAINNGLKYFTGEYLMWMDSDDILMKNNIEEKVSFLENNPNYGFVLCQGIVVNENNINKSIGILKRNKPNGNKDTIFSDLILEKNVVFCPAIILTRSSTFLKSIPTKEIYISREGQNWQLMLPLAYCSKCGYIEKPLFKYVVHDDSHSHQKRSYLQSIERQNEFQNILINTISNIPTISEKEINYWKNEIIIKHTKKKLFIAYRYINLKAMHQLKKELISLNVSLTFKDSFIFFIISKGYHKLKGIFR